MIGWWTPWTDDGRTGGNDEGEGRSAVVKAMLAALPKATSFRKLQFLARAGIPLMPGDWRDQDIGAIGIVLIESAGAVAWCLPRTAFLYTVNLNNPGTYRARWLQPTRPVSRPITTNWPRRRYSTLFSIKT